MPDTLSPEQMAQMQGGTANSSSPDTLSVQDMAKLQGGNNQPNTPSGTLPLGFGNFVGKALNTVEQPFINATATGVQTLAQGAYSLGGGKGTIDIFPKGINPNKSLTSESVPISNITTPEGWLQKAGSVGQIAATALAPEAEGIGGNALLGAASGFSQSLQSGETDIPQIAKDTMYGGLFGAAVGVLSSWMKGVGNLEQAKTGVVGQAQKEIENADPDMLQSYIDATKNHADDIRSATPDGLAEAEFRKRAQLLVTKVIPDAGKAVGAAKDAAAELPVVFRDATNGTEVSGREAVSSIADDINERMQQMTGHQFSSYGEGETSGIQINYPEGATTEGINPVEGSVTKVPGRAVELSSSETKQLERLDGYLKTLAENPTVQTASDMLTNIDNDIGKWKVPVYGENSGNTPVEGVLRYARGAVARIISPASPEIAAANELYGQLMDLKGDIGVEAGNKGQNASLAMRRVLSGDQAGDIIPLLDKLDAFVKPHLEGDESSLVQHAIISSWAKNTFGDPTTKTLLNQYINRDIGDTSTLFGQTKYLIKAGMQRTLGILSPDPEKFAMSVANGEPQSMNILARGIDSLVESSKAVPIMKQFVAGAKALGITSAQVEGVAKTMFKVWLIQQLTSPKQAQPEQSGPQTFLPDGLGRTLTQ